MSKKPNPITRTCYSSGRRKITSCHTPSIPMHSIPPKMPSSSVHSQPFHKNPIPSTLNKSGIEKLMKKDFCEKLRSSVNDRTKNVLLRDAIQNAAYFLLWSDSSISLGDISCQQSLWPSLSLSYKPSWKPNLWNFTLNYPKGWKARECKITMLKKKKRIKFNLAENQVIQEPFK